MRIGYARVSTEDQTLDLQRDALKQAKCREVYEEQASGNNTVRAPKAGTCHSRAEMLLPGTPVGTPGTGSLPEVE
jgi:DNA invertase Pin-like site-specific DNA recombinase